MMNMRGGTGAVRRSALLASLLAVGLLSGCGAPGDTGPRPGSEQAAAASAGAGAALVQAAEGHEHERDRRPALFAPDARPYGRSFESWAERWYAWGYALPAAQNPLLDPNASCDQHQEGPVFFLTNKNQAPCSVPRHKAVALPLAALLDDYPCPDPTFAPAPGQSLFDFLLADAKPVLDDIVALDATLDGQPLPDLLRYRVTSDDVFTFVGDPSLQSTYDACVTGSPQAGIVDSYFIILEPPRPGPHVVTKHALHRSGVTGTTTTTFTVRDDD